MTSTMTMTIDETATRRAELRAALNGQTIHREQLTKLYGTVWDTSELWRSFDVLGFEAPVVIVRRKRDNRSGTVLFQHAPRLYFGFEPT